MATDILPVSFDTTRSRDQHMDDHKRLHSVLYLHPGDDVQAALDQAAGRIVHLRMGIYDVANLVIRENTILQGDYGAVLNCTGTGTAVLCQHSQGGEYARVTLRNLTIRNGGAVAIGLHMDKCWAQVEQVQTKGFAQIGVKIEGAITSRYHELGVDSSPIGLLVSGGTSTTLVFSKCKFDMASDVAVKIEASVIDVTFTDATYFEASRRGLMADGVRTITLNGCYWEAIEQEYMQIGQQAHVESLVLINPIMIAGDNRVAPWSDLVQIDDVASTCWLGGDCRAPTAAIVRTTARTGRVVYLQPITQGQTEAFYSFDKVLLWHLNNRLYAQHIELRYADSGDWMLSAGYALTPGEFALSNLKTGHYLLRGLPDDTLEVILRSPNGTRYQLAVADNGALSTTLAS